MKKMWKFRKDSRAVSPVIATILMVAITVVLAAVLYVMVSGYGGGGETTPTGSFTTAENKGSGVYWLKTSSFSPETNWDACKLRVDNGTGSDTSTALEAGTLQALTVDGTNVNVTAIDLGGDGKISVGDYIKVELGGTGSYTFTLIFTQTGGSIDDISVTYA